MCVSVARERPAAGASAYLTPCVVISATLALALRQLGVPVGGLSFTVLLYLVLDFLAYRIGGTQPGLQRLRRSLSSATELPQSAAGSGKSVRGDGSTGDEGAKGQWSQEGSDGLGSERGGLKAGGLVAAASPSEGAVASTAAAAPEARSTGLRLSMLGTEIYVNGEAPFEFENEFFKGRMLFLVKCNPPDPKWAAHFEGANSNRAFEMQIQGKLKLLPKGEVYMGGELGERPKQGLVTQTLSKIVMSFAKQMVKSLHYSFGERRPSSDPLDVEKPHVTFPLYQVMDWFVVTPEGETPPALGGVLAESPEERAARRGGKSPDIKWSTDVTYTMAFQSGIVNFQEWAVTDVPGQGNLDLNTFLCKQPVSVVVYDFTAASASASTPHKARDKSYMFQCMISNDSPGHVARPPATQALAATVPAAAAGEAESDSLSAPPLSSAAIGNASPTAILPQSTEGGVVESDEGFSGMRGKPVLNATRVGELVDPLGGSAPGRDRQVSPPPSARLPSVASTGRLSTMVASISATGGGGLPSIQHQQQSAASSKSDSELGTSAPGERQAKGKGLVKSGAVLPLLMGDVGGGDTKFPTSLSQGLGDGNKYTSHDFLGEGNGGRVVMRRGTAMPAGLQVVKVGGGAQTFRSDHLYQGDVIVLHDPETRKFVKIGLGWALGWSSKASASKIHFVVKGIEPGRPLAHGQPFSLSSRRWSDWEVGVARQTSSKVGGRGLGCFNKGKRRNTSRLTPLTLVARPWFDGREEGVIPALEAERDAITISMRGPFEDIVSGGDDEDDDDDDGSEGARSEVEEGMSDSDNAEYDSDVGRTDVGRGLRTQSSLAENGISAKASRAMQCYPESVSFLDVSVPAWVEFLHRETRRGQLAFLVAVRATVPPPSPREKAAAEAAPSPSKAADATATLPSAASVAAAATATASAGNSSEASLGALTDSTASTSSPVKPAASAAGSTTGTAAEVGDDSSASLTAAAKPPSPSWTCVRTNRELGGAVQAYRESVGAGTATAGSWKPRERPRVIKHMGMADQSVRLLGHEISEMQRWEASFREDGDSGASSPSIKAKNPLTPGSSSTNIASSPGNANDPDTGMSPGGTPSRGDGDVLSPPRLLTPSSDGSPRGSSGNSTRPERLSSTPTPETALRSATSIDTSLSGRSVGGTPNAQQPVAVGAASTAAAADATNASADRGTGGTGTARRAGGVTAPYRLLCESVSSLGELDRHFLSGSSAGDLGVTIGPSAAPPILGSAVARCLWETHWREEWAVLLPSHVSCYPPLSKKPGWVLPLRALHKASVVSDERCPFPGLRCLRLETVGRVHYLCFTNRSIRDTWLAEISRLAKGRIVDPPSWLELSQDPREMHVLKTAQWKMPPRLVLNARRPGFDLQAGTHHALLRQGKRQPWAVAAQALLCASKVLADPGNKQLVPFLDLTSTFRTVNLGSLDLNSDETLCFFANLYHLLVMHMLLVLGPTSSAKEWSLNFSQVSYELGGDVFSLQELEHCVLRGRLPRPSLKDLPKRFAPLPPEGDDHYAYKLGKADERISLFLNNGSQSNPNTVVLLSPDMLDKQLNRACQAFVNHTVKADAKRRQITVHKNFQMYARDLQPGATSKEVVRYCLRFAGEAVIHGLSALDVDISQAYIRYHPYLLKSHETMFLVDLTEPKGDKASSSQR